MPLIPGTRLGPYEIVSALGAGGMGEVYRARDTRLGRDVAIKVLPEAFAADTERIVRFQREARTLAALNHPHIAQIYGLEQAGDVHALAMELVEGEDLSQRIARGPVPLDDALPIAKQIAEALEAAHEHGIVHRDLKPANIKLRSDGAVKVLDFGLAKAIEPAGSVVNPLHPPTITSPAMTQAGMILGTAAYMSPEQSRGKPVDKRGDIWAFGVVLFEMLTGQRAFQGEEMSDVLAAVLRHDIAWTELPVETPARLRWLLTRCLDRDPKQRLRDIGEARVAIERLIAGGWEDSQAIVNRGPPPLWRRAVPWATAASLGVALAAVLVLWPPWREAAPPTPLRMSIELGADVSLAVELRGDAASLSPDGALIAFVARKGIGENSQLYVRRLAQLEATPLSGTDNAHTPFFSPDGQWIAFFADGKLKKIAVTGGAAVILCDALNPRGGAWSEDDTIAFLPNQLGSLMRVSSAGGTPEPLTSLAEGEVTKRFPQVLPGGKSVLFTSSATGSAFNDATLVVQALPTGPRTVVQRGGYHGRYLSGGNGSPTPEGGHLVYVHDGTLFAAPFDLDRLAVTRPPVPVLQGLTSNEGMGSAQFAVSASGTLAYVPGQRTGAGAPIHWMDQKGRTLPLRSIRANWLNLLFAPDGRRLALQIFGEQADVYVYDWTREAMTRVTYDPASDTKPVWTPDGRRLVFASTRADLSTPNLYWQSADGSGSAQRLTESKNPQQPASWHPSGTFLAFEEQTSTTNNDVMILPLEGNEASGWKPGKPTVFLNSQFEEREPMFSPDGRWLAYWSTEGGRDEVWVQPFPGPGGKWLISSGGGSNPTWSRTKRELFYTVNSQIWVVPFVVEADEFRAEKPRLWADARFAARGPINRMFDLHPDGERVALGPADPTPGGARPTHLTLLFNFVDELRRIGATAQR